jgi:hypothetical protein
MARWEPLGEPATKEGGLWTPTILLKIKIRKYENGGWRIIIKKQLKRNQDRGVITYYLFL